MATEKPLFGSRRGNNMAHVEHTPGPWVVVGKEIHDRLTEFDDQGARIGSTPNSIAEIHVMPFGNETANARLIAAAPGMLAALEEMRWYLNSDKIRWSENANLPVKQWEARLDTAIAKARGE